ncbi:MAG: hypothetical protein ACR2FN_04225 [Chitinophagaceae bacterium]
MKENENEFDEFFRKKLGDYSSEIPDGMWGKINKKIKRDKKPINYKWLALAMMLVFIFLAGSYYVFYFNNEKTEKQNVSKVVNKNSSDKNIGLNEQNFSKKKKFNLFSDSEKNLKELKKNYADNLKQKFETNPSENYFSKITEQNRKNADSSLYNLALRDKTFNQNIIAKYNFILPEKSNQLLKFKKDSAITIINNLHKKPGLNSSKKHVFIEVSASPGFVFNNKTSANKNYLNQLNNTLENQLSYSIETKIGIKLNNRISILTGMEFSIINEKFHYVNTHATKQVTIVAPRLFTEPSGQIITINDTINYTQTGTRKKITYNNSKNINVPVLISYNISNKKISAAINAGLLFNVYSKNVGDMVDTAYNPISIQTNKIYKTNIGLSLYAGLNISTSINKNIALFAEPFVAKGFSNTTTSALPFKEKLNYAGMQVGLKYFLKSRQHK